MFISAKKQNIFNDKPYLNERVTIPANTVLHKPVKHLYLHSEIVLQTLAKFQML